MQENEELNIKYCPYCGDDLDAGTCALGIEEYYREFGTCPHQDTELHVDKF